jgi:hypothetical protein
MIIGGANRPLRVTRADQRHELLRHFFARYRTRAGTGTTAHSFLRRAKLDSGAFERLGRYDAALWKQTAQTLLLLGPIRRSSSASLGRFLRKCIASLEVPSTPSDVVETESGRRRVGADAALAKRSSIGGAACRFLPPEHNISAGRGGSERCPTCRRRHTDPGASLDR